MQPLQKQYGIRAVYNPTGEELKTLRQVYTRYHQMADARRGGSSSGHTFAERSNGIEADWDKWEKQWNAYRPPKSQDDWTSDIVIPLTSSIIEAQLAEIIEQTLRPWVVARTANDEAKAKVINSILTYTWEAAKSDVAMFHMIKDALIFGTGIGQEYYWKEPRTIKTPSGKTKEVLEFDDCYLEPVRLWDFFVDERAQSFTGPTRARDCIRRYIMDYDDFRTFFKGKTWDPMGNASKVKPGGDTNYYEFYIPPQRVEKDNLVEVLWYWNEPLDLLAIVANEVLVVSKPNPYIHKNLPFVRIVDVVRPYQFYGKGEAELLESIQEEANTLRRMIIDRNHLDIDKPVFVSDTLTIEDEDTIARPHGIVPVGDVNAIKFAEYSDIGVSVFKSLEMLNDDKIRVTGMDERQQGLATGGTATEASILKEATLKRLNLKMWMMRNDALVDIGILRVSNILQFYSQPKLEKITGDDVEKAKQQDALVKGEDGNNYKASYRNIRLKDQQFAINPQTRQPDIQPAKGYTFFEAKPDYFQPEAGGFDVHYMATPNIPLSKPLEQQKADELYDRLIKNPTVDPWKLAEYLLKTRDKEPDEFKRQQQAAPPGANGPAVDPQKMVDLAGAENAQMMQGQPVDPTPYSSPVHTEVHIEFIKSKRFKEEAPEDIVKLFIRHITGEIEAQKQRGAQGGQGPGGQGAPQGLPGMETPPTAELAGGPAGVLPGLVEGGAQTPNISGAQSQ